VDPRFAEWVRGAEAGEFWFASAAAALIGAAAAWAAFDALRRKRVVEDTPTARVRSAAQGYIELQGRAELIDGEPILGPLSGRTCTWFDYRIEHRERRGGDRRGHHWVVVERGRSDHLFHLADDTGRCVVDPDGASVSPGHRATWYGAERRPGRYHRDDGTWWARALGGLWHPYRYSEIRIEPGDPIYAIGHFTTHGSGAVFDEAAAAGEKLREWKRDRAGLLARFDSDGNGQVDLAEWEAARAAAAQEARAEHRATGGPPAVDLLGATGDRNRPFVIAAGTEESVIARHRRHVLGYGLAAAGLLGGTLLALGVRLGG